MSQTSKYLEATSLLLLVLIAFISFHDGGFALLASLNGGEITDFGDQQDCSGSACNEADACQCPVHLLEKLDDPTAPASLARVVSSSHFPVSHDILASRSLSPADPPPKA